MGNTALKYNESPDTSQMAGLVTMVSENDVFTVVVGAESFPARQAFSCLVRPEPGDEVALVNLADGRVFIAAILARASQSPPLMAFPVGFTVTSAGRADFVSQAAMSFTAKYLAAQASALDVRTSRFDFTGGLVNLLGRGWRLFGQTFSANVEKMMQNLGSSARLVRGHDETQAETVRQLAVKTYVTQAENVITTASETVRIDGDQINLA